MEHTDDQLLSNFSGSLINAHLKSLEKSPMEQLAKNAEISPSVEPNVEPTTLMPSRQNSKSVVLSSSQKISFTLDSLSFRDSVIHDNSPLIEDNVTMAGIFSRNPKDYLITSPIGINHYRFFLLLIGIGFGSSAIVYRATYIPHDLQVAIKMIDLDPFEKKQIDELRREIQVMHLSKHRNLLCIFASFVNETKLWIVMPYLEGGSCLDIIKAGFKNGFDEVVIATILYQALQGLAYLHRNGHIHRDFKAGNLLIDEEGTVKLADFGVSSCLTEDIERRGKRKTFVGTPCWMAPEVMEMSEKGYDSKADIWSFGITALELAYGHAPYSRYPPMKVIYMTLGSDPPSLDRKKGDKKYSKSFKDLIDLCLQKSPMLRPTAEELLQHPFFKISKKSAYLVEEILTAVPPLEERARSRKLMNKVNVSETLQKSQETVQSSNECKTIKNDENQWDFSCDDEDRYLEDSGQINKTTLGENETDDSKNSSVNQSSRFVIESKSTTTQEALLASESLGRAKEQECDIDTHQSIKSSITKLETEENLQFQVPEKDSCVNQESATNDTDTGEVEDATIQKGRFSVLESATGEPSPIISLESRSIISPQETEIISTLLPNPVEYSNNDPNHLKHRGVTATIPHTNTQETFSTTQSRFEVKAHPLSPIPEQTRSQHHHPQPQHSVNSEEFLFDGEEERIYESYGFDPTFNESGSTYGYYPRTRTSHNGHNPLYSPLIFVHPSQIDQLLLLNELVRQQLVELKNSAVFNSRNFCDQCRHPAYSPHGYETPIPNPEFDEDSAQNFSMEDPPVMPPPPLAAYALNSSRRDDYSLGYRCPKAQQIYMNHRRSMSIDQRPPMANFGSHREENMNTVLRPHSQYRPIHHHSLSHRSAYSMYSPSRSKRFDSESSRGQCSSLTNVSQSVSVPHQLPKPISNNDDVKSINLSSTAPTSITNTTVGTKTSL